MTALLIAGLSLLAPPPALASDAGSGGPDSFDQPAHTAPSKEGGLIRLDYQTIPIKGYEPLDLLGFHFYRRFNTWLSLGVGGHAPLVNGNYGGFMIFDVAAHAQRRLFWNLYADAGAALGGGGGGNSVEQSKIISGAGGFRKSYIGLGYEFRDFSVGVNVSNVRFTESAINDSQIDFHIQMPFSYYAGTYASSAASRSSAQSPNRSGASRGSSAYRVDVGLDNIVQIKPTGSYTGVINLADLQFSHYVTPRSYAFLEASVGYRGLPIYNQVLGGVGYEYSYSPRVSVRGQLGVGSGGYSPERIDTGPGLLLYPKLSAEYRLSDQLGISLSTGYLVAPQGTSRNLTLGAMLNYREPHADSDHLNGVTATDVLERGYRVHVFEQDTLNARVGDQSNGTLKLLSIQIDRMLSRNVYIPAQISVAYNRYLGYPGYGELAAGVGIQNAYTEGDRIQSFAQLLIGTNAAEVIAKPALGINYGLSDQLAIYGQVGAILSLVHTSQHPTPRFRSPTVGLGLTYRFSLPHE